MPIMIAPTTGALAGLTGTVATGLRKELDVCLEYAPAHAGQYGAPQTFQKFIPFRTWFLMPSSMGYPANMSYVIVKVRSTFTTMRLLLDPKHVTVKQANGVVSAQVLSAMGGGVTGISVPPGGGPGQGLHKLGGGPPLDPMAVKMAVLRALPHEAGLVDIETTYLRCRQLTLADPLKAVQNVESHVFFLNTVNQG